MEAGNYSATVTEKTQKETKKIGFNFSDKPK
jgi:hypothetical protein